MLERKQCSFFWKRRDNSSTLRRREDVIFFILEKENERVVSTRFSCFCREEKERHLKMKEYPLLLPSLYTLILLYLFPSISSTYRSSLVYTQEFHHFQQNKHIYPIPISHGSSRSST